MRLRLSLLVLAVSLFLGKGLAQTPKTLTWGNVASWEDPIAPYLRQFRADLKKAPAISPTGLTRKDYLKLIAGNVDFFKNHQNQDGAILDPYMKVEWQYSTPAFALAAAALVAHDGRQDLLEPAARAMDWAVTTLSQGRAATRHEDFFAPLIANALPLLKPRVAPARAAKWETQIRGFDPRRTYHGAASNWNVVALSGESIFHTLGLRDDVSFVEDKLAAQDRAFASPWGLYLEGPMAYDLFPRMWAADMVAHGYDGKYAKDLRELLRRGALTSLFMQSPHGELPAGGRSAHHQWNEAEQCVTYEIYGARALAEGDQELASVFQRAAHLSLAAIQRWVRPSGELWIVKNYVDPEKRHGYEGYSAHSQYNLLAMAMLALAHEHAAKTEGLKELPAPADVGGFVLSIDPALHKVFANAGGTYVEVEPIGYLAYDATGLIRVHARGVSPQLGPSDGVLAYPGYNVPQASPQRTGVGVSWKDVRGDWKTLGRLMEQKDIKKWTVKPVASSPERVAFDVVYEGSLYGVARIVEHYVVTPGQVELTTELADYSAPLRYVWPVLADDGRTQSTITVDQGMVSVSQDGGKTAQTFTPRGAASVRVGEERYANHNGWARLAVAEYPRGGPITLVIAPKHR